MYSEDDEDDTSDPEIDDRGLGGVGKCAGGMEIDDGAEVIEETKKEQSSSEE